MWTAPTVADFKSQFFRDFSYAATDDQSNLSKVVNQDITNALALAAIEFNPGLGFAKDADITLAFLQLTAYFLVESIKNSTKGFASHSNFPISSKNAGGVSVGFTIPDEFGKLPEIAKFANNGYGMLYLSMVIPFIRGGVGWAPGSQF